MCWDLRQAKIQLRDERLHRSETTVVKKCVRIHLVVRQNPERIAELFRRRLVLCYINL